MLRRRTRNADLVTLGIAVPRFRVRDLLAESTVSVLRHPGRSLLTALGTVLGAAAFVSTLGLGSTLEHQVSSSFDVRRATEIVVQPAESGVDPSWQDTDRLRRLRGLNGVVAAGSRILLDEQPVRRFASLSADEFKVKLMGADPGAVRAMDPRIVAGRAFGEFHETHGLRVALLPRPIAEEIGVSRPGCAVFILDQPYTVMGIFDDVARRPEAMLSIVVPALATKTLAARDPDMVKRDVIVETAPGAAQLISRQAPLALRPEGSSVLQAIAPPDPRTLRREIEGNVTRSSLLLSAIALLMGTVSIANAATAGIAARVQEIGLRRSVGGRPAHIFCQLLGETSMLGGVGSAVGALTGIFITSVVALWNGWIPVIDLGVALLALLGGVGAGMLAGLLPAMRAMRIEPVTALQR